MDPNKYVPYQNKQYAKKRVSMSTTAQVIAARGGPMDIPEAEINVREYKRRWLVLMAFVLLTARLIIMVTTK